MALQRILAMQVKCLVEVHGVDRRLETITGILWQAKAKLLERNGEGKAKNQVEETRDGMITREGSPADAATSSLPRNHSIIKEEPGDSSSFLDTAAISGMMPKSEESDPGITWDGGERGAAARKREREDDDHHEKGPGIKDVRKGSVDAGSEQSTDSIFERMILQAKASQEESRRKAQLLSQSEKDQSAGLPEHLYDPPKLYHTLVVCALGLLYLRAPLLLGDLRRWVRNGQLPYMSAHAHLHQRILENLAAGHKKVLQARV